MSSQLHILSRIIYTYCVLYIINVENNHGFVVFRSRLDPVIVRTRLLCCTLFRVWRILLFHPSQMLQRLSLLPMGGGDGRRENSLTS
jgi:hypothetical protein